MSQELHLDWVKLLSLVLLRLRALPKGPLSILPFELMYGQPFFTPSISPKISPLPDHLLTPLLSHLCSLLWDFIDHSLPQPCVNSWPPPIKIGDQVLFSSPDQCSSSLSPKWQGPFKVILVTPTVPSSRHFLIGFTYHILNLLLYSSRYPLIHSNSNRALFS